ncbi:DUF5994 family protein [Streptomyces sp. SD15]
MIPTLRLETAQARRGILDGAWWRLSRDIGAELPGRIAALGGRPASRSADAGRPLDPLDPREADTDPLPLKATALTMTLTSP